jgi:iron complex transport system permease protein
MSRHEQRRRTHLAWALGLVALVGGLAGLLAGSEGWSVAALRAACSPAGLDEATALILWEIRAPRTLGAWLTGALFGLAGAIAQGLFRNPLADPYLLGSAAGASLGVVLVLAAGSLAGSGVVTLTGVALEAAHGLSQAGLVVAAFLGALVGVGLTLSLARGAQHTTRLLLAGVVVGVVLGALNDLLTTVAPEALRGRQSFLLGTTSFLGWPGCAVLGGALLLTLPVGWRLARVLDALTLGEDSAASLGLALPRLRLVLVVLMALATGTAVAQAGMVAFVGLVAPHLVRRFVHATHGYRLVASAAMGGALLLVADGLARTLIAPQELPVGVLTAVLGGFYLLWLLQRREGAR